MENKTEGMEKLDRLGTWTNRKKIAKSVLRGCMSLLLLAIFTFCVIFSLEKGFENLITFLRSLFLQFTLVENFSFVLTILGYLISLLCTGSLVLTVLVWLLSKKVKKLDEESIVI